MKRWFYDQIQKEPKPMTNQELWRNRLIALLVIAVLVVLAMMERGM